MAVGTDKNRRIKIKVESPFTHVRVYLITRLDDHLELRDLIGYIPLKTGEWRGGGRDDADLDVAVREAWECWQKQNL